MKNKNAFTLAEVVIATVIIGILASLTIQTLFSNNVSRNNQYVAGLKKVYTELSYATDQIKASNSGTLIGIFDNSDDFVTEYCKYLKCSKTCRLGEVISGGCFNAQSDMKMLNSQNFWSDPANPSISGIVLADGTTVFIRVDSKDCTSDYDFERPLACGYINIDVNGFNSPNIFGRDIFQLLIKQDRIYYDGEVGDLTDHNTYCNPASSDIFDGVSCGARILKEGNMIY